MAGRSDSGGAAFVEVVAATEGAVGQAVAACGAGVSASGVEICLGNGRRIAVARHFDQQTLGRALALLEQTPVLPLAGQTAVRA